MAVSELVLLPLPGDRRTLAHPAIGSLRIEGLTRRRGIAVVGERRYTFECRWSSLRVEATDAHGDPVGSFVRNGSFSQNGTLRLGAATLTLQRRVGLLRVRYLVLDGTRRLAVLRNRVFGGFYVACDDPSAVDPAVLLLAAFVAAQFGRRAGAGAGVV